MTMLKCLGIFMSITLLAACGGGGGGADTPSVTPTTAVLKIALTGILPGGVAIAGAGCTVTLPTGVTPALFNGDVAAAVVTASGTFLGGTQVAPVYTAASGMTAGSIALTVANSAPAGVTQVGEVATVTLQLADTVTPSVGSFQVGNVRVIDTLGNPVSGFSAQVTHVTLQ